ncbi:hypothetical protein OUZ56_030144 [Daphnia magna]|uniref:C3H1-type domain-containing protein n=1 Tax=Daphnia magna TaxID=35525 RepID=A0ABQ9ZQE3_9CRUS|nr:hypothetical protein OUZ56_030144 [Daphnia magna]
MKMGCARGGRKIEIFAWIFLPLCCNYQLHGHSNCRLQKRCLNLHPKRIKEFLKFGRLGETKEKQKQNDVVISHLQYRNDEKIKKQRRNAQNEPWTRALGLGGLLFTLVSDYPSAIQFGSIVSCLYCQINSLLSAV